MFSAGLKIIAILAAMCLPPGFCADLASPVGLWKTIDDHTGQPRGAVRIYAHDGTLFGRVERTFIAEEADETCMHCTDERKDQKIVGMVILRNLAFDGHGYAGGDILDPESGAVYRCSLRLEDDGRKLVVRGYLGVPLLGRSQTWERLE